MPSGEENSVPASGVKWIRGAEPVALCMSCSATFPSDTSECPECHVALSVVRKCPHCERTQAAGHVTCVYCAGSFLQEAGLTPKLTGPITRRRERARRLSRTMLGGALAIGVIAGLALFWAKRLRQPPPSLMGQTYVLHETSMRSRPSPNAPPIKDLLPPEVCPITGYSIDEIGNRWFRITSGGISGYARTKDLAPPKGTEAENTFKLLQHSLMGLDDPAVLPEAEAAVRYYRMAFPESPHGDEVSWLLAERMRNLAGRSRQRSTLLASARELYGKLAEGGGEFAPRARQALAQLEAAAGQASGYRTSRTPGPLQFSVMRGPSAASPAGAPPRPVRRLTILSRTPLYVRLSEPARLTPGLTFRAYVAEDIVVNKEVAVPEGSVAYLRTVARESPSVADESASALKLELTTLVVGDQSYRVQAGAERISVPGRGDRNLLTQHVPELLEAGSRVQVRLRSPLVVTQP